MLRQARWLIYRDRVLEQLGALLLAYPRGRQFIGDFPALKPEMRRHFDDGSAPASAALQVAAKILGGLLGQLEPAERALVAARLGALDLDALKAIATERLARRRDDAAGPVELAIELGGVAIFVARGLAEEGTLAREEYSYLIGELENALSPVGGAEPLSRRFALPQRRTQWGGSE